MCSSDLTSPRIYIPNENFRIYLNKSSPIQRLIYSAVIVTKTANGWSVTGYDNLRPYFTIVPSDPNNNAYTLKEQSIGVAVYRDYKLIKQVIPYGTEFYSHQELADFFTSYSRYLQALGFVFDEVDQDLGVVRDWEDRKSTRLNSSH